MGPQRTAPHTILPQQRTARGGLLLAALVRPGAAGPADAADDRRRLAVPACRRARSAAGFGFRLAPRQLRCRAGNQSGSRARLVADRWPAVYRDADGLGPVL